MEFFRLGFEYLNSLKYNFMLNFIFIQVLQHQKDATKLS